MDVHLIEKLVCPYCAGSFRIARSCVQEQGRLRYGTIECRCFTFPIVDGILLLSLAKGYGGAEEALQPYVPMQVAALHYLARDDVQGLLGWMRRHAPLAAELIGGTSDSYLTMATRLDVAVEEEARRHLVQMGRYEVLGALRRGGLARARQWLRDLLPHRKQVNRQLELGRLTSYYVSRFFAPRVNSLALQIGSLPLNGRILSLCCGHGVFENLLMADGRNQDLVCADGQFLNLLITRRYSCPGATFICHDLQFPFPFADGFFDGVFSSTCLPEIPAQRSFAREAIRVTADSGWTVFDSIWNEDLGVERVSPRRHYRFCQNFFSRLEDYIPFFESCAVSGREVGIDIPGLPRKYLEGPTWVFGEARESVLGSRKDPQVSVILVNPARFKGFTQAQRNWLVPQRLSVSPVFEEHRSEGKLNLRRQENFARPAANFVQAEFPGYPEILEIDAGRCVNDPAYLLELYFAGHVAVLPLEFMADRKPIVA